jgi:hypothetical protein
VDLASEHFIDLPEFSVLSGELCFGGSFIGEALAQCSDNYFFRRVRSALRRALRRPRMFTSECSDPTTEFFLLVEPRAGNASACSHQFERDYRARVLKGLECRLCTSNRIEVQVLSVLHHAVDVPRMSEYDQVIRDWQSSGGEQIRKEYAESIAASS